MQPRSGVCFVDKPPVPRRKRLPQNRVAMPALALKARKPPPRPDRRLRSLSLIAHLTRVRNRWLIAADSNRDCGRQINRYRQVTSDGKRRDIASVICWIAQIVET